MIRPDTWRQSQGGRSNMRTKGLVRGIALVIFLLANTCSLAFAAETVSNEELIKELKAMKEVIAKQGERIAQLENQVNQETQENDRGRNVRGSAESSATGQDSLNNESLQSDKIGDNKKSLDREDSIDYTKSEYGQEESKQVPEERLSREEANRLLDAYNRNEKGLLRDGKKAYPAKNYSYNDW